MDGEVLVNYNGKDYTFDKSETVMSEGYGLMLDQINPLTAKTTNLVYKIPAELKGTAYIILHAQEVMTLSTWEISNDKFLR